MISNNHTNYFSYVAWAGVLAAAVLAMILSIPEPQLDWEGVVLPMTNRYVGWTGDDGDGNMSPTPLDGVNVVISGATSGIGRGATEAMTKLGANVIALGRNPAKLAALKQEVSKNNGSITTMVADYEDLDQVSNAAKTITDKFEHIDILLNNAGIHEGIMLLHDPVSKQGYDRIYSVNYLAHVLLTEKLGPALSRSKQKYPIVAQLSSSFHWVGDWSDLIPTSTGGPPPASQKGGTGGVFRTQRGYGNSKLAMIFHARALKRRNADLRNARIVR